MCADARSRILTATLLLTRLFDFYFVLAFKANKPANAFYHVQYSFILQIHINRF